MHDKCELFIVQRAQGLSLVDHPVVICWTPHRRNIDQCLQWGAVTTGGAIQTSVET